MTVIHGRNSHSRYPKRVITLDELSAITDPFAEKPQVKPREPRSAQVRFGQEQGLDWKPGERDPLAYLRVDRRRPVQPEKGLVPPQEWTWTG